MNEAIKKKIPRRFKKIIIIGVIILALVFAAFNIDLKTQKYRVFSPKITASVKIAFVSDLHSCKYGREQEKLISAITAENPDAIILGGDIVDDVMPREPAEIFLEKISELYPCFYVSGNHEYWSNDILQIKSIIIGYGIKILEGDCEELAVKGQKINICGVDDPLSREFDEQLEKCSALKDNGNYSILVSHRPEKIKEYLKLGYDLILSGHAHGGQWRIPFLMNGLIAPNQGLFPKYAGGHYEFPGCDFLVSRGLAKENRKVPRIFNPPELVIAEICPEIEN